MHIQEYLPKDMFNNHTVFVTGGGSGINFGIAKNFAALGANIGICGRSAEKLEKASAELRELGASVFAQSADVRDYSMLEKVMNACEETLGPISTLVCAAAGNFIIPAEQLSPNGFKAVMDIDLLGSFHACKAAFPQLKPVFGQFLPI